MFAIIYNGHLGIPRDARVTSTTSMTIFPKMSDFWNDLIEEGVFAVSFLPFVGDYHTFLRKGLPPEAHKGKSLAAQWLIWDEHSLRHTVARAIDDAKSMDDLDIDCHVIRLTKGYRAIFHAPMDTSGFKELSGLMYADATRKQISDYVKISNLDGGDSLEWISLAELWGRIELSKLGLTVTSMSPYAENPLFKPIDPDLMGMLQDLVDPQLEDTTTELYYPMGQYTGPSYHPDPSPVVEEEKPLPKKTRPKKVVKRKTRRLTRPETL